MSIKSRLSRLEGLLGFKPAWVMVFPHCETPEHGYDTDEQYYRSIAPVSTRKADANFIIHRHDCELSETTYEHVGDVQAFFEDIARNSGRIGLDRQEALR